MKYNKSRVEYKVDVQQYLLGGYVYSLNSLYAHYEELTDQRKARGVRYILADALTLITLAKLGEKMGQRGWLNG